MTRPAPCGPQRALRPIVLGYLGGRVCRRTRMPPIHEDESCAESCGAAEPPPDPGTLRPERYERS